MSASSPNLTSPSSISFDASVRYLTTGKQDSIPAGRLPFSALCRTAGSSAPSHAHACTDDHCMRRVQQTRCNMWHTTCIGIAAATVATAEGAGGGGALDVPASRGTQRCSHLLLKLAPLVVRERKLARLTPEDLAPLQRHAMLPTVAAMPRGAQSCGTRAIRAASALSRDSARTFGSDRRVLVVLTLCHRYRRPTAPAGRAALRPLARRRRRRPRPRLRPSARG